MGEGRIPATGWGSARLRAPGPTSLERFGGMGCGVLFDRDERRWFVCAPFPPVQFHLYKLWVPEGEMTFLVFFLSRRAPAPLARYKGLSSSCPVSLLQGVKFVNGGPVLAGCLLLSSEAVPSPR